MFTLYGVFKKDMIDEPIFINLIQVGYNKQPLGIPYLEESQRDLNIYVPEKVTTPRNGILTQKEPIKYIG